MDQPFRVYRSSIYQTNLVCTSNGTSEFQSRPDFRTNFITCLLIVCEIRLDLYQFSLLRTLLQVEEFWKARFQEIWSDTSQASPERFHHHASTHSLEMHLSVPCTECGQNDLMGKYHYPICGVYCRKCYCNHHPSNCQNCRSVTIPGRWYGGNLKANLDKASGCLKVLVYHPGVMVCELALIWLTFGNMAL